MIDQIKLNAAIERAKTAEAELTELQAEYESIKQDYDDSQDEIKKLEREARELTDVMIIPDMRYDTGLCIVAIATDNLQVQSNLKSFCEDVMWWREM